MSMKIYVVRHGQTDYNKAQLMQGRIDIPLNGTGIEQAKTAAKYVQGIRFDAVYSSPLDRAIKTAALISGFDEKNIIKDERIIEVSFGSYEKKPFKKLGFRMSVFWLLPEIIPAPKGVETVNEMVSRVKSFVRDLEKEHYENVLVVCHGGIIRAIKGVLQNAWRGIVWRPRPENCEIFVYEKTGSKYRLVQDIKTESDGS